MDLTPKILLIEGDKALREALSFSLELEGFRVAVLALPDPAEVEAEGANCLVIDYKLAGMDGLRLLDEVRSRGVKAPAILLATAPSKAIRDRAAQAGAILVEKPLLCDTLTAAIRTEVRTQAKAA